MGRILFVVVRLVPESSEKANEELEKQISEELSENISAIPWAKEIMKVTVLDDPRK